VSECPDFQRFDLPNGVSINVPVQSFPCTYEAVGNSVIVSPRLAPVDICDQIDELVNDQLANYPQRSGYDFPVNQDKCGHCGREWHGLKITARMEAMRQSGRYDESYRYADDDSEVLCEGSEFIGPMKYSARPAWDLGIITAGNMTAESYLAAINSFYEGVMGLRP
jgi:hypothetical protein